MWQMGGLRQMLRQAHHFLHYNPGKFKNADQHYGKEATRLYRVLNMHLSGRNYLVGSGRGTYTIAVMAVWSWVSHFK